MRVMRVHAEKVRKIYGSPMGPNGYAHMRRYKRGDTLSSHSDKGGPLVTVTCTISMSGSNPWPLKVGDKNYFLDVGDAVIFSSDTVHGREQPLEYDEHKQLTLHYGDA